MQWHANTCRICGEIKPNCTQIHIKTSLLKAKIKKCLKLEVYEEDFKPKQICDSCELKLNNFCDFIDECHCNDDKFNAILLNRPEWGPNETVLDYTQQKMSVIVTNNCSDIDLYKETDLPLENCINQHEILNYTENLDYLQPNYNIKQIQYQEAGVLRHSSSYQDAALNYTCQDGPIYDSFTPVRLDYANFSPSRESFAAGEPNLTFLPLKKPRLKKQSNKVFPCPHCDKKFKRRVSLNSHVAIHTKLRPYSCDLCRKTFAIKCDLTNHQKVHTDRNKCKFCGLRFPAPSKLERHLRTHTKVKPFRCGESGCMRSFSDKRNLETHKLLHTDVFDFRCEVCGRLFRTRSRLKQHEKRHAAGQVAGFKCEACGKVYKYKSTLVFHMKKHSGYFCSYCEMDCGKPVKLIKHKKVCPSKPN